jgi:dUTP pyrophosphatase
MDIRAAVQDALTIAPGARTVVPSGLAIEIPPGFEGQVRPRSGLAAQKGITLINSPGTIDADYRGELLVLVINHGSEPVVVERGDRIGQLVVSPVARAVWVEAKALTPTRRGRGGLGHTGTR